MIEWKYSSSVSSDRVAALLAPTTVWAIANRIASEMKITCCHFQNCDIYSDFGRVVYCVQVSSDLFDLFYNSPYGYRGAYFRSPGEGMDANAILIEALAPRLLEMSAAGASQEELTQIRESLLSNSAKAWLVENGSDFCPNCSGEWSPPQLVSPEILNGRWELGGSGSQCYGRMAPRLTKIRLLGAFLDDRLNEFVANRKRHRASDIHLWGWS